MNRLVTLLVFVAVACLAAGAFGALHDQLSYTVSSEYYTRFKFPQFRLLDEAVPARVRVAQVGFLASWWMGLPLGLLVGAAGLMQRTARARHAALAWSLTLCLGVTLAASLAGLLYGTWQTARPIQAAAYAGWYVPAGLTDLRRFLLAGYMHNAAYVGGALAVPLAWVFNAMYRRRTAAMHG